MQVTLGEQLLFSVEERPENSGGTVEQFSFGMELLVGLNQTLRRRRSPQLRPVKLPVGLPVGLPVWTVRNGSWYAMQ